MTLGKFTKILNDMQVLQDKATELYKLGVNIYDLILDPYWGVINSLIEEIYGTEGLEWIEWWSCDADFGEKDMKAKDEKGNPICYDIQSLWQHLEKIKP